VTSAGVTVLRRAFIAFLAYTHWLEKSRDKLSQSSKNATGACQPVRWGDKKSAKLFSLPPHPNNNMEVL